MRTIPVSSSGVSRITELRRVGRDREHDPVFVVAWSPDGARLCASTWMTRLWTFGDAVRSRTLSYDGGTDWGAAVFSPDSARVLTFCQAGRAFVHSTSNPRGGRTIRCVDDPMEADGLKTRILWATLMRGGREVWALTDYGLCHRIRVPDLDAPTARRVAIVHRDYSKKRRQTVNNDGFDGPAAVLSSRDGERAVVFTNTRALVYSSRGKELAHVTLCKGGAYGYYSSDGDMAIARALAPDGQRLAVALYSSKAVLVAPTDGTAEKATEIGTHNARVEAMAFSEDGAQLATGDEDGTAYVWRIGAGGAQGAGSAKPRELSHGKTVRSVAFSPDGGRLLTTDDNLLARIWRLDAADAPPLELPARGVISAAWHPSGRRVALGLRTGRVRVVDLAD